MTLGKLFTPMPLHRAIYLVQAKEQSHFMDGKISAGLTKINSSRLPHCPWYDL